MNWFESIDNYCERLDGTLFSEPLNLITNLAFIISAYWLWKDLKRIPKEMRRPGSRTLIIMIFSIGIGSSLFHSFGTRWAMMADVIPIAIFLLSYLYCFFRWEAKLKPLGAVIGLLAFAAVSAMTNAVSDHQLANGSEMYFGTWVTLFGLGCFMLGKPTAVKRWLTISASLAFSASMVMRTIDMRVCEDFPWGTHFAWHTLNGITLYLVTKSYIINARFGHRQF